MKGQHERRRAATHPLFAGRTDCRRAVGAGQRIADDPQFRDLSEAVEEELIDDYLKGLLSAERRDRFEKYFLNTPERHRKLQFAQALLTSVAPRRALGAQLMRFAALFVVAAALGAFLMRRPDPIASIELRPGNVRAPEKSDA